MAYIQWLCLAQLYGMCALLALARRVRARSTLIRLKIYHRQYYAFNQRCRICECYYCWYNPYFSANGWRRLLRAEKCQKWHLFSPLARSLPMLHGWLGGWTSAPIWRTTTTNKKAIWNFRLDLQPHKSWEAFTQKWTRAINDFYVKIASKRMAQMKRKKKTAPTTTKTTKY